MQSKSRSSKRTLIAIKLLLGSSLNLWTSSMRILLFKLKLYVVLKVGAGRDFKKAIWAAKSAKASYLFSSAVKLGTTSGF